MGTTQVSPAVYAFVCDACEVETTEGSAVPPPGWWQLTIPESNIGSGLIGPVCAAAGVTLIHEGEAWTVTRNG